MAAMKKSKNVRIKPVAWLWVFAVMIALLGVALFFIISQNQPAHYQGNLEWLALLLCLIISGICVIVATADKWIH